MAVNYVGRDGEPAAFVAAQMPLASSFGPLSKAVMERLHFDRFCTDYLLASGKLPYTAPVQGDRPDFHVLDVDGNETTLDCTQFVLADQRHAHALFRLIVQRVASERERFTHLRGAILTIWFRDDQHRPLLPPREADRTTADAVAEALAAYAFDPAATTVAGGPLPDPMPDIGIEQTDFGFGFSGTPLRGSLPDSPTFAALGFEFMLAYQASYTRAEVRDALEALIIKKGDTPTSDLLITVGGPARDGFCYPADEFFCTFALDSPLDVKVPSLHRVCVHHWSTGRIVQILPTWAGYPGLYSGRMPNHFVIQG
jgi:hypothetical protein